MGMSEYAFGILNWLGNRTYQESVRIFLGWTIIEGRGLTLVSTRGGFFREEKIIGKMNTSAF